MGTRSTYRLIEKGSYEGKTWKNTLALVYKQYDGYPEGHPIDTAKWLASGEMVNGIGMDSKGLIFNGAGCLAAQFIAENKDGAGGTYIYAPSHRGKCGENYLYDIIVDGKEITMVAYENNTSWNDNARVKAHKIFEGTPQEFVEKYEEVTA